MQLRSLHGYRVVVAALSVAFAAGCGGAAGNSSSTAVIPGVSALAAPEVQVGHKIRHVVIIVQENRTLDNLFHDFPGADTADYGKDSKGDVVRLKPESLTKPMDLDHRHVAYVTEYDQGKMDGFDLVHSRCKMRHAGGCRPGDLHAYGFTPEKEVEPYWALAKAYTLADHAFQTNQGPSFPAHQYLVSGTSKTFDNSPFWAAENPRGNHVGPSGGCDSEPGTHVTVIDSEGVESGGVFPCFARISLMDRITGAGLTWRYYQAHLGPGLWNAPDAIRNLRYGEGYRTDVVSPPKRVLDDIADGKLANVVWVTPTTRASDHSGETDGSGPSWVASIVNAIGESRYWNSTAIFITWDDWGGWFDHVAPRKINAYELGFRVPLIVVSPYAKHHYVSHVRYEFGSILKFTEKAFGLMPLETTDVRSNDLSDCFDFSLPPSRFKRISAPLGRDYFLSQPVSNDDPDDDW
jgi:phospholipase C